MLCLIVLLTGCDSREDKRNIKKWEAQASKNASHYIKEKYGWKARVKDCQCNRTDDMFGGSPLSECLVTMEYEDREFYVWIDGESKNTAGIDNCQTKKILHDFKEDVEDSLDTQTAYFQVIQRQCPFAVRKGEQYDNMFHTYYDGTNLYEVLSEYSIECCIFFADGRTVPEDAFDDIAERFDMTGGMYLAVFEVVSFSSRGGLSIAKDEVISNLRSHSGTLGIGDERLYIDNTLAADYGEEGSDKETIQYIKKRYGDIIYCYEAEKEGDCEIQKSEQEIDVGSFEGHGFINPQGISDSYDLINNKEGNGTENTYVTIYFPKEMISKEDAETACIIYTFINEEGEFYRKKAFMNEIGDYYAGAISCKPNEDGVQFMLAVEAKSR